MLYCQRAKFVRVSCLGLLENVADRYRVYPWSIRRRTEANKHRHGVNHQARHLVPGWANNRTRFQHCPCSHVSATQVRNSIISKIMILPYWILLRSLNFIEFILLCTSLKLKFHGNIFSSQGSWRGSLQENHAHVLDMLVRILVSGEKEFCKMRCVCLYVCLFLSSNVFNYSLQTQKVMSLVSLFHMKSLNPKSAPGKLSLNKGQNWLQNVILVTVFCYWCPLLLVETGETKPPSTIAPELGAFTLFHREHWGIMWSVQKENLSTEPRNDSNVESDGLDSRPSDPTFGSFLGSVDRFSLLIPGSIPRYSCSFEKCYRVGRPWFFGETFWLVAYETCQLL